MEERNERFEEHGVVEQAVHLLQSWWKAQKFGREIASHSVCWASTLVRSNGGSILFAKGTGAIVASFGPDHEHPPNTTRWSRAIFTSTFSGRSR